MSRIEPARRAFEANDLTGALAVLVDIWSAATDPKLAELIVKLGALVSVKVPPGEWETHARRGRPESLSPLLASIKGPAKLMKERVLLLTGWRADPRLDRWVVAQYAEPPFSSTGSGPFWTALKKLAFRLSDPIALANLGQVKSSRLQGIALPPLTPKGSFAPEELADLATLETAVDAATKPSKDRRTSDQLLTEVLENPGDLQLRHVLMDSLLELGDPRGELLALQLRPGPRAAADRKREKALIKEHWNHLLGPLAPALKPDSQFANGFLVHAEVRAAMSAAVDNAIAKAKGHPLWRTVESFSGQGSLLEAGSFPVLRAVDTYRVPLATLTRFSTLESITLRPSAGDLAVLAAPGVFPALHSMQVELTQPLLATFIDWAQHRTWRSLKFTTEPVGLHAHCELLTSPLALVTQRLELVVVQADNSTFHARTRVLIEGQRRVRLALELAAHQRWGEPLVRDAMTILETISRKSGLEIELELGNVERGPGSAALEARITSLGGQVASSPE